MSPQIIRVYHEDPSGQGAEVISSLRDSGVEANLLKTFVDSMHAVTGDLSGGLPLLSAYQAVKEKMEIAPKVLEMVYLRMFKEQRSKPNFASRKEQLEFDPACTLVYGLGKFPKAAATHLQRRVVLQAAADFALPEASGETIQDLISTVQGCYEAIHECDLLFVCVCLLRCC